MTSDRLAIYLNDHLAGATVGVELARRLRGSNEGDDRFGPALAEICAEIEADRETLERVMERAGVGRSTLKPAGAWAAEKLGRFKLNGQLRGYSPLSRLLELEALQLGVAAKARLWRALEPLGPSLDTDFENLAARAAEQRERVEQMHLAAAAEALDAGGN